MLLFAWYVYALALRHATLTEVNRLLATLEGFERNSRSATHSNVGRGGAAFATAFRRRCYDIRGGCGREWLDGNLYVPPVNDAR